MIAYLGLESQLLSTWEPEIEGANNLKKTPVAFDQEVYW